MRLSEIINNVDIIQAVGRAESAEIESITSNSNEVKNNSLFVAIKGFKSDGHQYLHDALNNGASAVMVEEGDAIPDELYKHSNCAKIIVKDTRYGMAQISSAFFGHPSTKLTLVGITGTKGKTTTSYFLKSIFETNGLKTGLLGTNKYVVGQKEFESKLTTPESNKINEMMFMMVNEGCSHCVMEVSSHAIELKRTAVLDFDFGVFTNITSDHLDFHHTFENYRDAKKFFFDSIPSNKSVIYNIDDKNYVSMIADCPAQKYSYGCGERADYRMGEIEYNLEGTRFTLLNKKEKVQIFTTLVGGFNAYNAAAAYTVAVNSGVTPAGALKGIAQTPQVPGRFEVISKGEKKVIVDYSHTSDSLKQALETIRNIVGNSQPVYTVFGCGGNRDKFKRPEMGSIAESLSDKIYVTSDNPRTEDPYDIINEILTGMKLNTHTVIENREEAIKTAISESEENAVVLIAGKGHENYQEINGVRTYFSDRETAEKYLG